MFAATFRRLSLALLLASAGAAVDLEREIVLAPHAGATPEDRAIAQWQERARGAAASATTWERLGWAFVAKARRTQDAGFYKLAEKTAGILERDPGAADVALLLRGHVLHNLHRFAEAESVARTLVARTVSPAALGLLSDALMEQGRLDAAVQALQRMVDASPGPEAFARIAHVRWLRGDPDGARAALESAVRMTSPREGETAAWMLVRLSALRLQAGDAPEALALAQAAQRRAPDYAPALSAEGRALVALDRARDALTPLARATELNPQPEYQWWLADVLRALGREPDAATVEAGLRRRGELADPRSTALFLATRGQHAELALTLARHELTQRGDVFSHDALAWALAARGEFAAAEAAMRQALAAGTQDARLFFHAAAISRGLGRADAAARWAERARANAFSLAPSERARLAEIFSHPTETQ